MTDNDRNLGREGEGSSFTATTWVSIAFLALLFGGVAFWAYQSGDMQSASNRPGVERNGAPTTTGQGSTPRMKEAAR